MRFGEDGEPIEAELLGADPSVDLALLKVDPEDVGGELQPLELGASEDLRPGDPAIAIGSPFGLAGTVTSGIVSALGRTIEAPNGFSISGAIQTDAAINPGNSGGPLLDEQGRVIGVNSQIRTGGGNANSGVGFAVPVDEIKRSLPALEKGEDPERAFLGVSSGQRRGGRSAGRRRRRRRPGGQGRPARGRHDRRDRRTSRCASRTTSRRSSTPAARVTRCVWSWSATANGVPSR